MINIFKFFWGGGRIIWPVDPNPNCPSALSHQGRVIHLLSGFLSSSILLVLKMEISVHVIRKKIDEHQQRVSINKLKFFWGFHGTQSYSAQFKKSDEWQSS